MNYDRLLQFARGVYHRLPFSDATKWRLRERVLPVLLAMRHRDRHITSAVLDTLRSPATTPARDLVRERRLAHALMSLASDCLKTGPVGHMIAIPFLGTGGAESVALNFARGVRLMSPKRTVLLVVTDRDHVTDRWTLPDGLVILRLAQFVDSGGYEVKQQLLEDLIVSIRPTALHNINSEVAWQLIVSRGEQLRRYTRLFASIFAFQFLNDGVTKTGYAAYFLRPGLPSLDALLTDNRRFASDACREYDVAEAEKKFHVVYNACRIESDGWIERAQARLDVARRNDRHRRPRFLWAGRLDKEKRVDLLYELVERSPSADFVVYGQSVVDEGAKRPAFPNLRFAGAFSDPAEMLRDDDFDAFVFTSKWEGLPNILVEIGALGLPIIAPTVGGVGELITSETGYPLPERANSNDYACALIEITENRKEAIDRAERLLELIARRHTWAAFVAAMKSVPGYCLPDVHVD